jgi:cell filamentation protein
VDDHYCWPGTDCLRNRLGLRDPARVDAAEATLVSFRDAALAHDILPGEYGLEHLKAFHRYLFQDLYDWAGETRTVDIHKLGATFGHWKYIDEQTSQVLHEVAQDGLLLGLNRTSIVERLAYYSGELNARQYAAGVPPAVRGCGRLAARLVRRTA